MARRFRTCVLVFLVTAAAPGLALADPNMLRVESLVVTPASPFSGNQVTITATFKNIALETAALNVDWVIQVGATVLRSGERAQLAAGVSFTETATWTAVAGSHTIRAFVGYDPQEQAVEYRNDNARTSPITVQRGVGDLAGPKPMPAAEIPAPVGRLPYRMELRVSPVSGATDSHNIVFSLNESGAPPAVRECRFEASPTTGGTFWSANGGSTCRVTTQLRPGTYRLLATVAGADSPTDSPTTLTSTISNYVVVAPPLATPVIVLGPVTNVGVNFNIDYTVCNVDTGAVYRPTVSPPGPFPGYAGNPPEDFVAQAFSNNGSQLTPSCPGGLTLTAGVKLAYNMPPPHGITGGRPACGGSLTYRLKVEARRGSESKTAETTFSVSPVTNKPCPD